jgi:hypothetical protein
MTLRPVALGRAANLKAICTLIEQRRFGKWGGEQVSPRPFYQDISKQNEHRATDHDGGGRNEF